MDLCFSQGSAWRQKIKTAGKEEGESSCVSKTSKENKDKCAGREGGNGWQKEIEGRETDRHESRNISDMKLQRTSQKKTRCSNLMPGVRKKNQIRIM